MRRLALALVLALAAPASAHAAFAELPRRRSAPGRRDFTRRANGALRFKLQTLDASGRRVTQRVRARL